jgi:hypothetical protein
LAVSNPVEGTTESSTSQSAHAKLGVDMYLLLRLQAAIAVVRCAPVRSHCSGVWYLGIVYDIDVARYLVPTERRCSMK